MNGLTSEKKRWRFIANNHLDPLISLLLATCILYGTHHFQIYY